MAVSSIWGQAGAEPPISTLLSDPICQALMRADGVSLGELQAYIERLQSFIRKLAPADPAALEPLRTAFLQR